jgi:hypothetical protein
MPENTKLPSEFSDLQDLADLFALSDDSKRYERLNSYSIEERR